MLTSELYHVAGLGFCDANLITFLQKPLEAAGWCQPLRAGSAAEKWLTLLVCKNRVELSFTSFFLFHFFILELPQNPAQPRERSLSASFCPWVSAALQQRRCCILSVSVEIIRKLNYVC